MPDEHSLGTIYIGWHRYQSLLADALARLTTDQLGLRATPSLRTVGELAVHIIAARVYWFHWVLGEGDADLALLQTWEDSGQPVRSAADLVDALHQTWRLVQAALDRWTPDDLAATATTARGRTVTRGWVIWHVVEHDLHHGGEICLTLGIHGLPTPDL